MSLLSRPSLMIPLERHKARLGQRIVRAAAGIVEAARDAAARGAGGTNNAEVAKLAVASVQGISAVAIAPAAEGNESGFQSRLPRNYWQMKWYRPILSTTSYWPRMT